MRVGAVCADSYQCFTTSLASPHAFLSSADACLGSSTESQKRTSTGVSSSTAIFFNSRTLGSTRSFSRWERYVGVTGNRSARSRCFMPCSVRRLRMVLPKRIIGPPCLRNQRVRSCFSRPKTASRIRLSDPENSVTCAKHHRTLETRPAGISTALVVLASSSQSARIVEWKRRRCLAFSPPRRFGADKNSRSSRTVSTARHICLLFLVRFGTLHPPFLGP